MSPGAARGPAFEVLLDWLADDRDRAGERYEAIRSRLVKIFVCRGCPAPEDLADETIDRVTSKAPDLVTRYVGPPEAYFYRVAQFVYYEHLRKQRRPAPGFVEPPEDREAESACLEGCLETLAPEDRELILSYYGEDSRRRIEGRKELAARLGIGLNALRLRLHRIRKQLRTCLEGCLEGARTQKVEGTARRRP